MRIKEGTIYKDPITALIRNLDRGLVRGSAKGLAPLYT